MTGVPDGAVPVRRPRPTWSERQAAVALLLRIAGPDGTPSATYVREVAERHGVCTSAVYAWLRDDRLRAGQERKTREQFTITLDHLAVLANEQNAFDAHEVLTEAGLVTCSYRTFARALSERTDPALAQAALSGHPGFVNNRVYLRFVAPHRGHTWHWDHPTADVWVWPSHKHSLPVRPFLSVVVDSTHAYWLAVVASPNPINAEHVTAVLAQGAALREEHGMVVGGLPAVMTFDNAAEHHAAALREGMARLGVIPDPSKPRHPWQNGKAERPIGLINQKLCAKLPGATAKQAGTDANGDPRFAASTPSKTEVGQAVTWGVFTDMLEALRDKVNTTYRMRRLGNLTRAQSWAADPTELAAVEPGVMAQSMLKAARHHVVNGDGIHFASHIYVAPEMVTMKGQYLRVRHFPTNRSYIELFSLDDEYLFRAWDTDRLTPEQKAAFMATRRKQEDDNRAVQAGVQAHRRHLAVVLDDLRAREAGNDPDSGAEPTEEVGPVRRQLPRAPKPAEPDAVDRATRQAASTRLQELNARRAQQEIEAAGCPEVEQ